MPTFGTTAKLFGGYTLKRSLMRTLQADHRWLVSAGGWVDPKDANTATVSIVYEKDDQSVVVLGSVSKTGSGREKTWIEECDVFGTPGVPAGEEIPIIRFRAVKDAGVEGEVDGWALWIRHQPFTG